MTGPRISISLEQFRLKGTFVSFETLRGLIDMLRFMGPVSVDYDGGDAFTVRPVDVANPDVWVSQTLSRLRSFGLRGEKVQS